MKKLFLLHLMSFTLLFISLNGQVTFRMDMQKPIELGLFVPHENDTLIVRGSFNNWSGNDWALTDQNEDGIYEATYIMDADSGTVLEYKYVIVKQGGRELWEKQPNKENEPYGNRIIRYSGKPQQTNSTTFDFDKYYLPLVGKEVIFSVAEMQEDFTTFRKTLENEHCCLYEYTSKETFNALFDQQYKLIDKPLKPHEFYRILSPLTAKIGCGHTSVYMPGGYWETDAENFFPLEIKLLKGSTSEFPAFKELMLVSGSYTDSIQVPFGSIIHEINNEPVGEILGYLRNNYSADAFNIHFINSQIERRFPLIYIRSYGFPDEYVIKYSIPGDTSIRGIVLEPATNPAVRTVIFKDFINPEMKHEVLKENNTAILTISSFNYYDRVPYFREYLENFFKTIQEEHIENLILDLRKNDGGDPFCAAPLFSYLMREPVPYFAEPYGKYAELSAPLPIPEYYFNGNIIILMDGRCFSTNAHLCSLIKYHKVGKIVGTESGGTYTCNAGKNIVKLLENSGIQLYFGRSSFAVAVEGMDKTQPIMPDYPVTETYDDFKSRNDVFMETAFKLINMEVTPQ